MSIRRRLHLVPWLLLAATAAAAFEPPAPRHALVIGNAAYPDAPLAHAGNDARDLAAALQRLDYAVSLHLDLDSEAMTTVVQRFYAAIDAPDAITLFYYAGHALQYDSANFLLPVGAAIDSAEALAGRAFLLDRLLFLIGESSSAQNIIILDACRDNPFATSGDAALARLDDGLAPVEAPANTLVAYATEPGSVASDGDGRNGVYTAALLRHIGEAIPAERLFRKVRNDVMAATGRRQVPWEHSSLTERFYFGPPVNREISDIVSF